MDIEQRANWRIKRLDKRITLTEIAKKIGCTHNNISMFENCISNMDQKKVKMYVEIIESTPKRNSIKQVVR